MTTPFRARRVLTPAGATAVAAAAEQTATDKDFKVVVAVVDHAGELLHLRTTEGAQVASARVAVDKARTAAIFVRPSRDIEEQVSAGRLGALALQGAAALTGGIPLRVDGQVVGAVGTSGETPDEDELVSIAAAALEPATELAPSLTFEGARAAAEAAAAEAARRGVAPVVAVVDADGALLYLHRPDEAQVASVGVAQDKARTAAIYRRPSRDFEEQATGGRPSALHLARAVPLQGGLPILSDGVVAGAIGVSGASSADEDSELAAVGVEAVDALAAHAPRAARSAVHIPATDVRAAFQSGGLLVDEPRYKVDAGRREGGGPAEWHELVTDVMYVLEGEATVVTGGELADATVVAEGERRGSSIVGGTRGVLRRGDVLVVPAGVPHQFTSTSVPFLYHVVKVVAR